MCQASDGLRQEWEGPGEELLAACQTPRDLPREMGQCSHSRYHARRFPQGSPLNPFSHPAEPQLVPPLAEKETVSEKMETWPGFIAQKQQSGFKAMLLLERVLSSVPRAWQFPARFVVMGLGQQLGRVAPDLRTMDHRYAFFLVFFRITGLPSCF